MFDALKSLSTQTVQNPLATMGNVSTGDFIIGGAAPYIPSGDQLIGGSQTISASGSNLVVIGAFALFAAMMLKKGR